MQHNTTRRRVLQWTGGALAVSALRNSPASTLAVSQPAEPAHAAGSFEAPHPTAFEPLPLGAIKPAGWLRRQLRIQADGMTGHLHDAWPDVGPNSGWLGGTGESWERGPYFVDGLLPLAVLLDDDRLRTIANHFVEWTLTHQQPNGMIGPATNDDWWPRMVMAKVLLQHLEATGDTRVVPVLTRYFHYQLAAMPARPLHSWGRFRWQDEAHVVLSLYSKTHDPKLLQLAQLLRQQGFDWVSSFSNYPFRDKVDRKDLLDGTTSVNNDVGYRAHGVNNGQALKTAAVQARMGDVAANRAGFYRQLGTLDRYHGMPTGMFTCDEHLAGRSPSQGTELCTVVETLFSLQVALATFGDAPLADRIERIAYNALPATLSADMWAHQYDQQVNQVQCSLNSKPWTTNGAESNLFGLEPHFGCCTANYHQGWPKLVASLWMRSHNDGLAAVLYGPCEVRTQVRGTAVHVAEQTDYPFRDTITLTLTPEQPVRFPLQLRIPEWATHATVRVDGREHPAAATPGTFVTIEREWTARTTVELTLPMRPRVERGLNRSVALLRGPLLYSHSPGESWVVLRDRKPFTDWQVFPTAQWNYALAVDEASAPNLVVVERPIGERPFAADSPPVTLQVPAHRVDSWRAVDGVAPPPPMSPVTVSTPEQQLALVPYGTARLRVSVFPQASA